MRYLDFTPVMIVALASVVGARYLAIGTGDTELYIFAGMLAAVVISIRVFAQCQLLFNIGDNYFLTLAEWPPNSVTVSGAR